MARGRKNKPLTKMHPRDPWERIDGETDKAWAAFRAYRDAGPLRRRIAVARKFYDRPDLKATPATWSGWARKYDWRGRIEAYDAFLVEQARHRQDAIATALKDAILMRAQDIAETVAMGATGEMELTRTQLDAAKFCLTALGVSAPKQLEISGPGGGSIQVASELQMLVGQMDHLSDEDLDRAEQLLIDLEGGTEDDA